MSLKVKIYILFDTIVNKDSLEKSLFTSIQN